jgi:hypothetical protein
VVAGSFYKPPRTASSGAANRLGLISCDVIARFGPEAQSEAWLRKDTAWQYRRFYGAV